MELIMSKYSYLLFFVGMAFSQDASCRVPYIKMNDGKLMPGIALGTYLGAGVNGLTEPSDKTVRDAVVQAINIGYRHIDTAAIYQVEDQIGEALKIKFQEGSVKREHIFITTKLWNTHHKREQVPQGLRESLQKLQLDYVDMYLIHWPFGLNANYTSSPVDFMETWRGMEDVQKLGLTKSIGLSNFNAEQILRVLEEGTVKPAALQIEMHPNIIQTELLALCREHNIVVMAYSPLGSLVSRFGTFFPGVKMDNPTLVAIAQKYGKTVPQIVLRWEIEKNVVPLPKSVNPNRLKQNFEIFDFKLTEEEIEQINSFNSNSRLILPSFWQDHKYYPFEKSDDPIADPFLKKSTEETKL